MASQSNTANISDFLSEEQQLRVDLAAAFRLAVHFDWHESIANHFSAVIANDSEATDSGAKDSGTRDGADDGKTFLLNPKWKHFSTIKASELLKLHADDKEAMQRADAPDPSAWCIHGAIHAALPHARVLLHCHPTYATALAGLKDPSIKPIDQNTARFHNRMAIDLEFGGIADDENEGTRIASAFGNHSIMMMGNHGVSVVGETVAEAFDNLYYLERAAKTMVLAYSTGQPLNIMSDELAEKTALGWEQYAESADAHFEQLKGILDKTDSSYRD